MERKSGHVVYSPRPLSRYQNRYMNIINLLLNLLRIITYSYVARICMKRYKFEMPSLPSSDYCNNVLHFVIVGCLLEKRVLQMSITLQQKVCYD